jgi:hypothetical protein
MEKNIQGKNIGKSGKLAQYYTGGTFSVIIEIGDLDPAIHDDEATLESSDGEYRQTLPVARDGFRINDKYLRVTFAGVQAGKDYTLTYNLKKDQEGHDLGKIIMFNKRPLESKDMDNLEPIDNNPPLKKNAPEVPPWESTAFSFDIISIYQEPDPDADEEAIALEEESKNRQSLK